MAFLINHFAGNLVLQTAFAIERLLVLVCSDTASALAG